MTRSVGGQAGIERTARDAVVGKSAIRTTGTGETATELSRSGVTGEDTGTAGAGGTFGVSQSHRRQWQPGVSVGAGTDAAADFAGWGHGALSPQQDTSAATRDAAGAQQDRFLAPGWQHDFIVCGGTAAVCSAAAKCLLAGAAQTQARTGVTASITVETASSRQTNDRIRHRVGMKASYTCPFAAVNSIRPPAAENRREPRSAVRANLTTETKTISEMADILHWTEQQDE